MLSRVFYYWAVAAVPAWGDLVMAGFNCYLPKLAELLGYQLPKTDAKRRQFWEQFSSVVGYRRYPDGSPYFKPEDWLCTARG